MASQKQILEIISEAQEGISYGDLAGSLDTPSGSLSKPLAALKKKGEITQDDEGLYCITDKGRRALEVEVEAKPTGEKPVEYIDVERRFAQLLQRYAIKDKDIPRIVDYISAQGEDAYRNFETLRRCLIEQAVAPAKAGILLKHWASLEGLEFPQALAQEIEATTPVAQPKQLPDRWSLIGDTPTRDPSGELTWLQCLQLLQTRSQPQQTSQQSDVVRLLVEQNQQVLQQLADQRWGSVGGSIEGIRSELRDLRQGQREINSFNVMDRVVAEGFSELRGLRSDVKGFGETMAKMNIPPGPPRTPQDKSRVAAIGKAAIATERRAREIEDAILGGGPSSYPARKTATPANPPQIISE